MVQRLVSAPARAAGFAYVAVLLAVAVAAILATHAMENGQTRERHGREDELLAVGTAYREAIRSYYENSPGSLKAYPPDLDALLEDARTSTLRRHLRKRYRDPLTGSRDWGLVQTEDGRVKGVFSLAARAPLKTGGFPPPYAAFAHAQTYRDWQFTYEPQ